MSDTSKAKKLKLNLSLGGSRSGTPLSSRPGSPAPGRAGTPDGVKGMTNNKTSEKKSDFLTKLCFRSNARLNSTSSWSCWPTKLSHSSRNPRRHPSLWHSQSRSSQDLPPAYRRKPPSIHRYCQGCQRLWQRRPSATSGRVERYLKERGRPGERDGQGEIFRLII